MNLNYLTEKEMEMSRDEVNLQIVLGLQSCETKEDVCHLLDDVREHECYIRRKTQREQASQEIQQTLEALKE